MDTFDSPTFPDLPLPVEGARQPVRPAGDDILDLQRRLDRLVLINAALWELVKEKTGAQDIELTAKLVEVQAMAEADQHCRQCGKRLQAKRPRCMYCGHDNVVQSMISGV